VLIDDHAEAMAQLKSNSSNVFIVIEAKEDELTKANRMASIRYTNR